MALKKYPGYGADDTATADPFAVTADDPTTALQTLLSGGGAADRTSSDGGITAYDAGRRNSAIAGAVRKRYGLGPDNGDMSQADLEALDKFVREGNLSETMPPIMAKGANDAAMEAAKAKSALDVANTQGQYALQGDKVKGTTAEDVANIGAQGRVDAAGAKGGGFVMGPDGFPINTKPLGQLEQRAITSFGEAMPVLNELQSKLHPNDNQFMSWMKNAGTGAAYNMGIASDPAEQAKYQLSGLLSIIGSSPYVVGSRSFQMIKLAMQHLTSPMSSDKFKSQQIDEIRTLWPQMQQEILAAHMNPADPRITQPQAAENPNDPSTWARKQ